jgi:hypothetical protein
MNPSRARWIAFACGFVATAGAASLSVRAATGHGRTQGTVPTDVQLPGTQPDDVLTDLHDPNACAGCHGSYNPAVEPTHQWRGSMMAHSSRDPMFWATLAVAEQDFAGGGDFCIRCHVPSGWLAGRSVPTDGASLDTTRDVQGVECDQCHRLTNPDGSEYAGVQLPPFVANDGGTPATGYYGSGQYVMWNGPPNGSPYGPSKLGPYSNPVSPHTTGQSLYHRSPEMCGTCHEVSNPLTGDLAPGNGAQLPLAPGTFSGVPGTAVGGKAAFNNFPYAYGVVERTYSELKASLLDTLPVSQFATLPAELQQGALRYAYEQAQEAGQGGDFEDGTTRFFTCQTCHMTPTTGQGCSLNPPMRGDLARHDLTGGNYWMPDAIQWMSQQGLLILGGGLTPAQVTALNDGKVRARASLSRAAALSVTANTLRVVNLTGHKLITGYPEGRRMWIRQRWYDPTGALLREDGAYGAITAIVNGQPTQVDTLLDLSGANTRVYETHGAISQAWAQKLIATLGVSASLPVAFDRTSGAVTTTLGDVAAQAPGTAHETFHFLLNDTSVKDNRIPPYGMSYDEARTRNALPVPAGQFGNPGPGGTYQYFDQVALNPPSGATYATLDLLYQPTSWEYIQFLQRANTGQVVRLAQEGANLLSAWRATGMAAPHVMASASWGTPSLSAGDCARAEDQGGCALEVRLSAPSTQTVTVGYGTADGTATSASGDYDVTAGTITFPPGTTTATVTAPVHADTALEPDETFSVNLSNPVGAAVVDAQGIATILNDEAPIASVGDCSAAEGSVGPAGCSFAVTLSQPTTASARVSYGTADFTAGAGADYSAAAGVITFPPGTTVQNVDVAVIDDLVPEPGETFELRLSAPVQASLGGALGRGTIADNDGFASEVHELVHGFSVRTDLRAQPGPTADRDVYQVVQEPYSSYELIVDECSGDFGPNGPTVELVSASAPPLASQPVGSGSARALRFANTTAVRRTSDHVAISASPCGTACGPDDVYRVRFRETTYSIPRFNNTGSQGTVLVLQNPTERAVAARVFFWDAAGAVIASVPVALVPHQTFVLNTATAAPGAGGTVTVTHDGGYGSLIGKAVALEPATGFSFDSPMVPRAR